MLKFFNQLMYFFGYAPIKISHQIKRIQFNERINFESIKVEEIFDDTEFEYLFRIETKNINYNDEAKLIIRQKLIKKFVEKYWYLFDVEAFYDPLRRQTAFRTSFFFGKDKDLLDNKNRF